MNGLTIEEVIAKCKVCANIEIDEVIAEKILNDEANVDTFKGIVTRYTRITNLKSRNAPDIIIRNEERLFKDALIKFDDMISQIN